MREKIRVLLLALAMILVSGILFASVDLNTASARDLEALKGVGPATAKKIIAARPYRAVSELTKAGLSPKQISEISPLVTVGVAAAPSPTPPVATKTTTRVSRTAAVAPAGPVDLNTASSKDLEALRGVGPATAKKIIAARPFRSVEELSRAGLSAKQISSIAPLVTVSGAMPASVSVATKPARGAPPSPSSPGTVAAPMARPQASNPAGPVDLNTASLKELEALKGVGLVSAKKIIAARPYRSVDELTKAGLSANVIASIKPLVTVAVPAAAPQTRTASVPSAAPVPSSAPAPAARPATTRPAAAPRTAPRLAAGQIVNINTASLETLELLPGIGPVKAQAIINGRPYNAPEDVMKVRGIKQGEFAQIRNSISVR